MAEPDLDAWAEPDEAWPAEAGAGATEAWEPVEAWDDDADGWGSDTIATDDEHEYLVFVEEEDDGSPADDRLVLAVARQHALGQLQVHPEIEVELRSTATPTSTSGLAASIFGALMGITAIAMFVATYPQRWYEGGRLLADEPLIWFNAVFAVLGGMFLVIGTVLTHYGQRLQASGNLRRLRIVEQATGRSANLE